MKNTILICFIIFNSAHLSAQIKSSHDGFYSADSIFYHLAGKDSFKYCINCYTADSLHNYTGAVWIHSRESAPNTWENNRFSEGSDSTNLSSIRANVPKGNTVWVRIFNDTGYTDQHHFIFLGKWRPKASTVVSVVLDSADFMGANGFYGPGAGMNESAGFIWNYRLKLEKNCSYQVYSGKELKLEAQQTAGVEMSGWGSAIFPDKPIELNANQTNNKSKVLELGKSLTDSLGKEIKILRFRLGSYMIYRTNVLSSEIVTDIIHPANGGEPSTPVCLFINGSFWTYAMAEEGTGRNFISKALKTKINALVSAKVIPITPTTKFIKRGLTLTPINSSLYAACGLTNICNTVFVCDDMVELDVDTAGSGANPEAFETLCTAVRHSSDSVMMAAIDRESFYRYALTIWFFQVPDPWGYHVTLAKAGTAPWKIFSDHFDFNPQSASANDWNKYIAGFPNQAHEASRKTLPWMITKRLLKSDADNFCLLFEDELNTTYKSERIVPIAQKKIASLRPCIAECSRAWAPNGWLDSLSWENAVSDILPFLKERSNGIASALPKIFMAGADTLFALTDMQEVSVNFDSLLANDVIVKLNSLELRRNFTGKYYPQPELRIEIIYDRAKYRFVKWLEYPNSPESLRISAKRPITLTPILKRRNEKK